MRLSTFCGLHRDTEHLERGKEWFLLTKTPYTGLVWHRTEADPETLQNTPWQMQTRHHVFVTEALGSSIFFFLYLYNSRDW
jgi:hypothetical protein